MMSWIVGTSMRLRFLVLVIAAVLVAFGVAQAKEMPLDLYPEFNPPMVEVQTEALGLAATEVESLITVPMEADLLNGVAWLEHIYSESVAGMSSILLVFEPGTNPIRARQMVQERLAEAYALPNVSKPPAMLQPLSTTSRVMMVGLSSHELSLIDMGVLARWTIMPRLMGVPGVANVAIWGQRDWQLQVQVDTDLLQAQGITLGQIVETTGEALWVSPLSFLEASSPGTAGWIDTPNQRISIRHILPISSAEDLAQVSIVGSDGLQLGDVTNVVEDHQPLIGDASLGSGPGLLMVIEKFPDANTLEVTRGVEAAIELMRPGLSGIEIDQNLFRPAKYIELAASNLTTILLVSAALMLLVLGAFLFEWRSALISLVAISASLVAVVFILNAFGAGMNVMVLTGLVMGLAIVIDDVTVDVENITRRLRQQREASGSVSAMDVIQAAAIEMRGPLAFALLIILVSSVPALTLLGLPGKFFQPLVVTYVAAIAASLLVALLITPALCLFLLPSAAVQRRESPLMQWLQRLYTRILSRTITMPRQMVAVAVVLTLIGAAIVPFLKVSMLPEIKQTDLLITWEAPAGTSRSEMNRVLAQVSQELRTIPGVANVGSHVGRAITGDQVVGMNSAEIWVSLDPHANYDQTVAAIDQATEGYPGALHTVQTYKPALLEEALSMNQEHLVVRLYGVDYEVLRAKSQEVMDAIAGTRGIADMQAEAMLEEPQVQIQVDLAAAEQYHIKPGDVRRSATTLLSGLQVGNLYEEQKVFDVVVLGEPEIRDSLTDINELLIDTPDGGHVRLGDVANVTIVPTPITIHRDAVSRYVDITVFVAGRSLGSVAREIGPKIQGVSFPLEHHAEILGDYEKVMAAQQRLIATAAMCVVGIFLLLQASFKSWRLAFVGSATLPVALVGGVLAILLSGGVLSLGALFAFLPLIALSVRHSILLANRCYAMQWQESQTYGAKLVANVAMERLAPVLRSVFTTAAALLPMLFAGNIAGLEVVRPMAIVLLGGLVTTTLLDLIIFPALYLRYGSVTEANIELVAVPAPSQP